MAKIVAIGEILIDFTPGGTSERGRRLYECNPGGAPANMLSCAAQFGHECELLACVGQDVFGDDIIRALEAAGLGTNYVKRSDKPTTLAVVSLTAGGERSFGFYREQTADTDILASEVERKMLDGAQLLHIGSLSLTHEPVRSATIRMMDMAREMGVPISYDPNYRPMLWKSREIARESMLLPLEYASVVKLSDDELEFITGENDMERGAAAMLERGMSALAITRGAQGCDYFTRGGARGHIAAHTGGVVDTTGAGDYFFGGAIGTLLKDGALPKVFMRGNEGDGEIFARACAVGNDCGFAVAQQRGALGIKIF